MNWVGQRREFGPEILRVLGEPDGLRVATESGAVKKIIHTKRKDIIWPMLLGP